MHKLVILLGILDDPTNYEEDWPVFLKLVEQMPGLRREAFSRITHALYGDFPYQAIYELYFDTLEAAQSAMRSEAGKKAGQLLQDITRGRMVLLFADHKEDELENIAKYKSRGNDE